MIPALTQQRGISIADYWKKLQDRIEAPDPQLQNNSIIEVLKHARDVTFHYFEERNELSRIRSGLKNLAAEVVPIGLEGRWVIADEIRMQFLQKVGFITSGPFDVHIEKIPAVEIGYIVQSLLKVYLESRRQ